MTQASSPVPIHRLLARLERGRATQDDAEALVLFFIQQLGLRFRAWCRKASLPGTADAIADGTGLLFTRWHIACRITDVITEDDAAATVGLALLQHPNAILFITTGDLSTEAQAYCADVAASTNHNIVIVDRADLANLATDPSRISEILQRSCVRAASAHRRRAGSTVGRIL